ncbi:MAG: hypothetical protein WC889_19620, partial [Myxococcota bacterium]
APTKTLRQQGLHKTELTARLRRHRSIPCSKTENHIHPILQQALKGGEVDRRDSGETDEGCSSGVRRWGSLEHPSSVAFGDTLSRKGRR